LKVAVKADPTLESFETNDITKYMEKLTNVKIEWQPIPMAGMAEKVGIILAGWTLPDVFLNCALTNAMLLKFGPQEKTLIPLRKLIEQNAPNIQKAFTYYPDTWSRITSVDGDVYALPGIYDLYHFRFQVKYWMNQPWLDKLSLKKPTTTDEFVSVLKAFKEKDPNGNGKKDEIPLTGALKSWFAEPETFLLNSFLYYDGKPFYIKGNQLFVPVVQPEYREGLRYMNKLYADGLLYEATYTQDMNQCKALTGNAEVSLVGAFGIGAKSSMIPPINARYKEYSSLLPLKGPKGVAVSPDTYISNVQGGAFSIAKVCKTPEVAIKWVDYMYSTEGTLTVKYGLKDAGWRTATADEKGLDGRNAVWMNLVAFSSGKTQNKRWGNIGPIFENSNIQAAIQNVDITTAEGVEKLLYDYTKALSAYAGDGKMLPDLFLTEEETKQILTLSVEINNYLLENRIRFITGNLSLDNDWDKYAAKLNEMGFDKMLKVYQTAFERQYKSAK
jgi:putative aldouronate transport system substrate-binding protein